MLPQLPLRCRRLLARIVALLGAMNGRMPIARETVLAMMFLTGLGRKAAATAARRNNEVRLANALDWAAFSKRSSSGLNRDLHRLRAIGDVDASSNDDSVVLTGPHSGSLPMAIAWICHELYNGWPLVLIRTNDGDEEESATAARLPLLGVEATVLTLSKPSEYVAALRRARRRTVIVCLADLPPSNGKARVGDWLWHQVDLAGGVLELARVCRAGVLLFSAIAGRSCDTIHLKMLAAPADLMAGDLAQLQGEIDRWISRAIADHPEQWHHWERVKDYRPRRLS